jgi:GNAT superfamily N-acetyltransferase
MLEIRPVTVRDLSLLQRAAIAAYSDHYLHLWYDKAKWYIERCFSLTTIKLELENPNCTFFLAFWDQEPVGFLKLNLHAAFEDIPGTEALELERIYLTKKATGKGIGSQLVHTSLQIAKHLHKKCIWLKAMDSSMEAIAFYKSQGFTICGTHTLEFPQMIESYRGMVIMKKEILQEK